MRIFFQVFRNESLLSEGECEVPFIIGRQSSELEPGPVCVVNGEKPRLVIAALENRNVPRNSALVEVDSQGQICVQNVHRSVDLYFLNGTILAPNSRSNMGAGGNICLPDQHRVHLALDKSNEAKAQPDTDGLLSFMPIDTGSRMGAANPSDRLFSMLEVSTDFQMPVQRQELAVRLVKTALEAFKEPAGSHKFFEAAANAALQILDMDRVLVLRKVGDQWTCRASAARGLSNKSDDTFSHNLLVKIEQTGKTTVVEPQVTEQAVWASMTSVDRAVAAPILDGREGVVGALYGEREIGGQSGDRPIGELEAVMLDVLASGISSSLALEKEQQLRSSMSQFFSPLVLSQLRNDPDLLAGRETDVSVLFCDIRGFSGITEKIGPKRAIDWINGVLTVLSECVLAHDGVLVDYVGDELMAMWGAPGNQPDHAIRACEAALDMLAQIDPLSVKWSDIVPERFGFGIGICSGPACVGNTGSQTKFKYGPLGNTVNLASRVQGITKQFRVPGIMTGQTAVAAKAGNFQTRRLAQVRVVGMQQPVELLQLNARSAGTRDLFTRYEAALDSFENCDLRGAAGQLASLVQEYPDDGPSIILLSRVVEFLSQPEHEFDPVWQLKTK